MAGKPLAPANGLPPLLSSRGREGGGNVSGSGEGGDGAAALGDLGGGEWPVLCGSVGGADVLGLDDSVVQGEGNGGRLLHVGGPSAVGENILVLDDPLEEGAGSGVLLQQQEGSSIGAYEKTRKNVGVPCLEEDKVKVLEGGPWYVQRRPLILRPWSLKVCLERVDLCSVPVWVSLPNLPFHYWSVDALSSIGSVIGKPIVTDKMTRSMERLSYARLCVEVSADRDLPFSVPVYGDDDSNMNKSRSKKEWRVKGVARNNGGAMGGSNGNGQQVHNDEVGDEQPDSGAGANTKGLDSVSLISIKNKGNGSFKSAGNHPKIRELSQSNPFAILEDLTEEVHYDPEDLMLDSESCAILLGKELLEGADFEEDIQPNPLAIIPKEKDGVIGEICGENPIYNGNHVSMELAKAKSVEDIREATDSAEVAPNHSMRQTPIQIQRNGAAHMEGDNLLEDSILSNEKESAPMKSLTNFDKLRKQSAEIRAAQGQMGKGWDPNFYDVVLVQKSKQFIHAKVSIVGTSVFFFCTVVYALNSMVARKELWEDVGAIASAIINPWAVLGDLNVIRSNNEKIGGDPVRIEAMDDFNSFIDGAGLLDLKWKGETLTWNNRQVGDARICCKLDRVLVNLAWKDVFRSSDATFYPPRLSDHSPMVVAVGWEQPMNLALNPILKFAARLRNVKKGLRSWNKECVGDVFLVVKEAEADLFQIQRQLSEHPDDPNLVLMETQAKKKLWEALATEEKFLKEKSRVKHIQLGDGNNSFFYKSRGLSQAHQESLTRRISNKEIMEVVFVFKNSKAPGPDGFGAAFYKHSWEIVGEDLTLAVKWFFMKSYLPSSVNATFICLIPKTGDVTSFAGYRPIALCNLFYKIITKVLSNRLQGVIGQVVNDCHAFIKGREASAVDLSPSGVLYLLVKNLWFAWCSQDKAGVYVLEFSMGWPISSS
ncbi:uncharacterized protein LOC122647340 [Telopea speciosissima]|uniref:uncharacterized protein LOC122647340 n=1 Tax=Telopea speciosissima TaxID=54955 RepID=UPI001CC4F809|nr:uncharacterized protein LOC122647340 [Telopea speciosissima]